MLGEKTGPTCFLKYSKRLRDVKRLDAFLANPRVENYFNLFGYFTKEEIDVLVGEVSDSNQLTDGRSNQLPTNEPTTKNQLPTTNEPTATWYARYVEKVRGLTAAFKGRKKFFAYEFKGFLASHNNVYGYQAAKAAGVECRCPILDARLAAAWFAEIDAPRFAGKKRLTKILSDELGADFVKVRKSGFRFPVEERVAKFTRADFAALEKSGLLSPSAWPLVDTYLALAPTARLDEVYMKLWSLWTLNSLVRWLKG